VPKERKTTAKRKAPVKTNSSAKLAAQVLPYIAASDIPFLGVHGRLRSGTVTILTRPRTHQIQNLATSTLRLLLNRRRPARMMTTLRPPRGRKSWEELHGREPRWDFALIAWVSMGLIFSRRRKSVNRQRKRRRANPIHRHPMLDILLWLFFSLLISYAVCIVLYR
jgi:hypothetical protein